MASLYFDNAATSSPKPKCVYAAVADALINSNGNPGRSIHEAAERAAKTVFEAREAICRYFGSADTDNVFFTLNATAAINTVILGMKLKNGKILISDIEHNAVLRSVAEKCRREDLGIKIFKTYPDSKERSLYSFKNACTADVCCVAVNAASNVDGRILPIKEIGEICKRRSIPFIIDASQLAGHSRIDLNDIHYTALCCAGHKALFSPMGCGFGIIGDIEADIEPLIYGGNGISSKEIIVPKTMPERFECGTVPVPNIAGLLAGVRYLEKNGNAVMKKERENCALIIDNLQKIDGINIFHSELGVPVISIEHNIKDCDTIGNLLSERGIAVRTGFHCAPLAHYSIGTYEGGTLRISPSAFNSFGDCTYLTESIKKIVL